jgi:4-amino-4-deoxy-L-arabinose transferase-like glycosyltransferase
MPLTACFTIAMLAWLEWFNDGSRSWLLVFYAFSALGMLAKGPVAPLLAGLLIVAFATIRRQGSLIVRTLWWPGILLFLLLSLPWYIAVQLKTGDFFRVFIVEHNLARFGTDLYRHHQPFWYYIPVVIAAVMPWAAVFLAEVVQLARQVRGWRADSKFMPLTLFAALWFFIPILFFSLSKSKLPGYILPSIPAAALLIVAYLHDREESRLPIFIAILHALGCGALLAGVLLAPHFLLRIPPPAAAIRTAAAAAIFVFAIVLLAVVRRGIRVMHAVTLLPILLAVAFIVKAAAPSLDATQSARPVAAEITRVLPAHVPIVVYRVPRQTEYGLPFYGFPVTVVDNASRDRLLPSSLYVLITQAAYAREITGGAPITPLGAFPPQRLEFYLVSPDVKPQ